MFGKVVGWSKKSRPGSCVEEGSFHGPSLSFFFTLRRFKLWITFAVHSSEAVCENTEVINPIKFTCQILLRLKCRLSANDSKARCTRATLWYFSHTNIYISCVLTHHSDWTTVCSLLHMGSYLPPYENRYL